MRTTVSRVSDVITRHVRAAGWPHSEWSSSCSGHSAIFCSIFFIAQLNVIIFPVISCRLRRDQRPSAECCSHEERENWEPRISNFTTTNFNKRAQRNKQKGEESETHLKVASNRNFVMIKTPTKPDSVLAFVSSSFVLALGVATHMYLVHVHCSFRFSHQERHHRLVESNDAFDTITSERRYQSAHSRRFLQKFLTNRLQVKCS